MSILLALNQSQYLLKVLFSEAMKTTVDDRLYPVMRKVEQFVDMKMGGGYFKSVFFIRLPTPSLALPLLGGGNFCLFHQQVFEH